MPPSPTAGRPDGTLLLALQLPTVRRGGTVWIEQQAANGLRLWLQHFGRVVLACPERVDGDAGGHVPLAELPFADRVEVLALPLDYSVAGFLRKLRPALPRIRAAVAEADYILVAPGYLAGDWPGVVAVIADRAGRRYGVWTDRVEWHAIDLESRAKPLVAGAYGRLMARAVRRYHERIIRRAGIGLFHGMSTFDVYAPLSSNPHVVHDVHVPAHFRAPAEVVAAKEARARSGAAPLRIGYVGRVHPDKGPDDWLRALAQARDAGADFEAVWYGDGPLLEAARRTAAELKLADRVRFPGAIPFERISEAMRAADLFLFCHKTLESPRNLIESLMSGTPLVGYHSAYAADLSERGSLLTPTDDVAALAGSVAALAADGTRLAAMVGAAAADGAHFSDEEVFRHRSALLRTLPAAGPLPA